MPRTLYYSVSFQTLHQNNPGYDIYSDQGNPYLTVGGFETSKRQYSLAFGFGDPGGAPDAFDYCEWSVSYATFIRPTTYGSMGTYQVEAAGGGTTTLSYSIWNVMTVQDEFILPAEFLSPSATEVMHSYLDYARKLLIDEAQAQGLPFGNLASQLNSTAGLYSTLQTHMERQFKLIDDAIAGRIDANMLMQLSDQAAFAFGTNLTGKAAGIPGPLVLAMRSLVGAHIATQNSQEDYAIAHFNTGVAGFFVPPFPTSIREVGSLESDVLYDHDTSRDVVVGGPGNDLVHGGPGTDILVGGAGNDTLSYGGMGADLDISLTRNSTVSATGHFVDSLAGFENVIGGSGVNRIEGNNVANMLNGQYGTDNFLSGLGGNDQLVGGTGRDSLNGGTGSDTAFYYRGVFDPIRFTYTGLVLSLENPAINTGDARGDVWLSIENISGTDTHDLIVGNIQANWLSGNQGNDRIFARGGNDTLVGGAGADHLDGGGGTDVASYAGAPAGVVASLIRSVINTGHASGDTFIFIENLIGSKYSDQLFGNMWANGLSGGTGNDLFFAYAGNDTLDGGLGIDRMHGGAGADRFLFRSVADSYAAASDTIYDFALWEGDRVDLSSIDASTKLLGNQAFSFIGTAAFRGIAGDLRYVKATAGTYIYGDVNGDKLVDLKIHLDDQITLTRDNFVL